MTLHQTYLSLGSLLEQHPELADLKLEFMCPKLECSLKGTIALVKTTQEHLYQVSKVESVTDPKDNRTGESLVWNYCRPVGDEHRSRKVLAKYPVQP